MASTCPISVSSLNATLRHGWDCLRRRGEQDVIPCWTGTLRKPSVGLGGEAAACGNCTSGYAHWRGPHFLHVQPHCYIRDLFSSKFENNLWLTTNLTNPYPNSIILASVSIFLRLEPGKPPSAFNNFLARGYR